MITIIGGNGFIGRNLARRLVKDDHKVAVVDNFVSSDVDLELTGIVDRFIQADVTWDTQFVNKILPTLKESTEVYYLASIASPKLYYQKKLETFKANTVGLMHVLQTAKEVGFKTLYTSTSEIYGNPDVHPQVETYHGNVNPYSTRAIYDESKRMGETLCKAYQDDHNLDIKIARIFNTYGPGMQLYDGRVVVEFIKKALQGEDIPIHAPGRQTRSFTYIDDLVDGLIKLMGSDVIEPVNLGNPNTEVTMIELANLINNTLETWVNVGIVGQPYDHDPQRRQPDISKAQKLLGWNPTIGLKEGILKLAAYVKSELKFS